MADRQEGMEAFSNQGLTLDQAARTLGINPPAVEMEEEASAPASDTPDATDSSAWDLLPGAFNRTVGDFVGGAGALYDRFTGDGEIEGTGDELAEQVGPSPEQEELARERREQRKQAAEDGEISDTERFVGDVGDIAVEALPEVGASATGGALTYYLAKQGLGKLASKIPGVGGAVAKKAEPWLSKALGVAGAAAPDAALKYEEGVQRAAEEGLDVNDPDVQDRIDWRAAGGTLLETFTPARLFGLGSAGKEVSQAISKNVIKKGPGAVLTEGLTELTDFALSEAMLNEDVRQKFQDSDLEEFLPWAADRLGRDAALSLAAGGLLGGAASAPVSAREQALTNAKAQEDTRRLAETMKPLGLDVPDIEQIARTPEGMKKLREATESIGLSETTRRQQKRLAERVDDPEFQAAVNKDADERADANIDKQAEKLGAPMRVADLKKQQRDAAEARRRDAIESLGSRGLTVPDGVETPVVTKVAEDVEKAEADLTDKRDRAEAVSDPEMKVDAENDLADARQKAREARITAKMKLGGKSYEQASDDVQKDERREAQRAGRERAVQRQIDVEMPTSMPDDQRAERAREIIAEDQSKSRGDKGLENKIKRLERQRRAATSGEDIDRLTNEIADLEARRGLPTPAVEAAQRVLQASEQASQGGAEEASPSTAQAPAGERAQTGSREASTSASTGEAPTRTDARPVDVPSASRAALDRAASEIDNAMRPREGDTVTPEMAREQVPDLDRKIAEYIQKIADDAEGGDVNEVEAFDLLADLRDDLADGGGNTLDGLRTPRAAAGSDAEAETQPRAASRSDTEDTAVDTTIDTTTRALRQAVNRAADTSGYDLPNGGSYRDLTADLAVNEDLYDFMRRQSEGGIEVSAHVRDGSPMAVGTNDTANLVMPPKAGFADPDVTFVHTHTTDTPFSAGDVRAMLHAQQPFVALLPNGENLSMRPLGVYDEGTEGLIERLFSEVGARAPRYLSGTDRARIRQEALLQLLEINGTLDYDRPMQGMSEQHMEIVNGIVSDLEGTLPGDGAGGNVGARPAQASPQRGQVGGARAQDPEGDAGTPEGVDDLATPGEDAGGDVDAIGILENQTQRLSRSDKRPTFDQERVRQLASEVIEARKKRGARTQWYKDYRSGELSQENVEAALKRAVEFHGFKKALVLPEVVKVMYPDLRTTVDDFARRKRKQGRSTRSGNTYYPMVNEEKQAKFKAALELLNDTRLAERGGFTRQPDELMKGRFTYRPAFHEVSEDLMDFVGFQYPESVQFLPPVPDPTDTRFIKRQPQSMRFSSEAMRPLERTARYLQENRYTIDKDKLYALTPDDLISSKAFGDWGFRPDDVPYLDTLLDKDRDDWPEDAQSTFPDAGVKKFLSARKTAAYKLEQLRSAYSDFAATYGEDAEVGFMYQVDARGRIYADGSFHPQAGSKIKSIFKHNGVSLGDMVEVDNSASGWQINALVSRDHVAAPNLNMGAGQASDPNFIKKDLYTDTLEKVRPLLKRDAEVRPERIQDSRQRKLAEEKKRIAQMFLNGPFRDGVDIKSIVDRNAIKPPIIAQNYGAETKKFQDVFQSVLQSQINENELKSTDRPWGYMANRGMEALGNTAPHSIAFKNWAIDAISKTVSAVENGTSKYDPPKVEVSIGMDGRFATKRHRAIDGTLRARSTSAGQLAFKMKGKSKSLEFDENGRPIPILDKNGNQKTKEEHIEVPLKVRRDEVDPKATARAYWANIIQSLDAAVLHRSVERYKQVTDGAFVTTNHDSFTVPPEHEGAISSAVRESMATIMSEVDVPGRLYADLQAAAAKAGVEVNIEPFNDMGEYNLDDLATSTPLFGEAPGRGDGFVPQYDELPPSEPFLRAGMDNEPPAVAGQPTPLYVSRMVQNGEDIKSWAESQGLPVTVDPQDMHFTTTFSREPVDVGDVTTDESGRVTRTPVTGRLARMGDALVLEFPPDTLGLSQDHQKYRDAGASYDYDAYRPHITLSYDAGNIDLTGMPDFTGQVRVGPEEQRVLAPDDGPPSPGGQTPLSSEDVDVAGRASRPAAPREPARAQDMFGRVQDSLDGETSYIAPPPTRESWATTIQRRMNTPGKDDPFMNRFGRYLEGKVVTDQAGLMQIERKLGVGGALVHEGMSRMTQMLTNEQSRINLAFYHAPPKWDKDALLMRADSSAKPLAEIFKFNGPEDYKAFNQYAYARRDRGLIRRGKDPRIVETLRNQWLDIPDADKDRYDAMLDEYRKFNDSILTLMEDASLISSEQKAALQEDEEYVPMFRTFSDAAEFGMDDFFGNTGGLSHPDPGIQSLKDDPIKIGETVYNDDGSVRFSGGQLGDLISNIQKSTAAAIMAANQNIAHQRIYDFMSGRLAHESGKIEEATGVRTKTLSPREKKKAQRSGETDAVMFYRDGEPVYWKLEGDPEMTNSLMVALSGLKPDQLDALDKVLLGFQDFQRTVITSTPDFAIASLQRDVGQAYIQSDTRPLSIVGKNLKSLKNSVTGESQDMLDVMMGAGVGGYQYQAERDVRTQDILQRSGGARRTPFDAGRQALARYERAIGSTELGVRKAVYDRFIKAGYSEADAMYEARNHIDYGRRGSSATLRRFMRMILFLNPRIQGNYRIFELTTGDRKKRIVGLSTSLATRGLVYMGITLALRNLLMADEEDEQAYQDIPVEERSRAMHFPIPGSERLFKWEHPFELGAMFGSVPTQMFDQMIGVTDSADSARLAAHIFGETFSLNPIPEIGKPVLEVVANYSFFLGIPIEGMAEKSLPSAQRADARTGGIAKALGGSQLSPVEIQHLAEGYLGPLGMYFYSQIEHQLANMGIVDPKTQQRVGPFKGLPPEGKMTADEFASRFFTKTDRERNVAAVREFYQFHQKIGQATTYLNFQSEAQNFEEARRFAEENRKYIRLKPLFNTAANQASKVRRQMRITMETETLDQEEKDARLAEMQYRLNKIYRNAVRKAEKAGLEKGFFQGLVGQ
jgi:hypothetical protein